jgi:hypothetical protein
MTRIIGNFPIGTLTDLDLSFLGGLVIEIELIREGESVLGKMEWLTVY